MVQLQKDLADIEATGTRVVGISPDSVEILKKFSDEGQIGFTLLSDESSKTIHAFGIHAKSGLPHPGTYLIDKTGTVRAALFIDGYRDRHPNAELIAAAKGIE